MDNVNIWIILGFASAIASIFSRVAAYNEKSKSWWFFEIWRDFASYFMTAITGYFFITIRWPEIRVTRNLSLSDYILFFVFFIGILGWWPYMIKNITEGINVIIERFLKRKVKGHLS